MKTRTIFAIALTVVFALFAQVHTVLTTGKGLEPSEYPAYVSNLATYGYEEFGIKDNLVPAVKREWRNFRMTVTYNVNDLLEAVSTAREKAFSEADQATDLAPLTSLRPKTRKEGMGTQDKQGSNLAPLTSPRPKKRPEGLAQKFAIQQALQEAQG